MSNQHLFDRAYGLVSNKVLERRTTSRLLHALHAAPTKFCYQVAPKDDPYRRMPAHPAGVNAITIDRFEGRYLLSGGANSSVAIWDLEAQNEGDRNRLPLTAVGKTSDEHKMGVTQVAFYPFDSLAFLTSSYDHTVKVYASETLEKSATFGLGSIIYNIALSPIATHLLVACATQHPDVRLIDLRSGAKSHSLAGHVGSVLSVAWSPTRENVLVSGATDGTVRFWDIRRSVGHLGMLDLEDSSGVSDASGMWLSRKSVSVQAHRGAVNGIVWTEDGRHLVTCGHDQRVRVWNVDTGANTLANFGPMVRNSGFAPRVPLLAPPHCVQHNMDIMFYPNDYEIMMYELFEGRLIHRLRRTAGEGNVSMHANTIGRGTQIVVKDKISSLAWRAHTLELYSAHADGDITVWAPRTGEDAVLDDEEDEQRSLLEIGKKRKRNVLDDIYRDLTKPNVPFGNMGM